jgi:isopentenyldiphosphate isomerase
MTNVTFVDENDTVIGYGPRSEAIEKGLAHRIARVFVFNSNGELLIQKRSPKVKLAGKWDQSAAGHVDEGEDYVTAAAREANEEIGLKDVPLTEIGKFYTEEVDENKVKKRFNMLYVATYDGDLVKDNDEVSEIKWIKPSELTAWMDERPDDFTEGFIQTHKYYVHR